MTIMLAGGLTFAIPGVIPDVSAQSKETANLYVSTTTFGGPMIVEVIVRDSNLSDTDEDEAEPDVTFDGNDLRMVQATDGYWYAYVADTNSVLAINQDVGLNFGELCANPAEANTLFANADFDVSSTVYVSGNTCAVQTVHDPLNVIRNAKTLNNAENRDTTIGVGNNHLRDDSYWPFIQTFVFADDANIDVVYSGGGSSQDINLTYDVDMDDFASYSLDRDSYPHGADVHLTISDNQLNIDPTDEDVWTFNTFNGEAYYYLFDGNGEQQIDDPTVADLDAASFGDNGILIIDQSPSTNNNQPILLLGNNDDQGGNDNPDDGPSDALLTHIGVGSDSIVTVQETSPNSGVFSATDDSHDSILSTTDDPELRDLDFTIDYNDSTTNYIVEYFVGMVSIDLSSIGSDWGSGESLSVSVTDQDENSNTLVDDDFDASASEFIPTIQIGNPFTLEQATSIMAGGRSIVALSDAVADAMADQARDVENLRISTEAYQDIDQSLSTDGTTLRVLTATLETAQGVIDDRQEFLDNRPTVAGEIEAARNLIAINTETVTNTQSLIDVIYDHEADTAEKRIIDNFRGNQTALTVAEAKVATLTASGSNISVGDFSKIATLVSENAVPTPTITIETGFTRDARAIDDAGVFQFVNFDVRSLGGNPSLTVDGGPTWTAQQGLERIDNVDFNGPLTIEITGTNALVANDEYNIIFDVFTFGQAENGMRFNDAIYRFEAEETGTNTGVYGGTLEYIMLNQINIFEAETYAGLATISDELDIIVHEDLTDEDAVELIYRDADGQGIRTQTSAKIDAPTYSGVVSFDGDNYKVADTVTITLEDRDLNTDSDVIDIYTVVGDTISLADIPDRSLVLHVTFDDNPWNSCTTTATDTVDSENIEGLGDVISGIRETGTDTGVFTTNFQIPELYCNDHNVAESVTGLDLEVNYNDFRDASGEEIEVGDSAGIRATTGSVALDRTVYPVPFGQPDTSDSFFPVHATAIDDDTLATAVTADGRHLESGILTVHVRVNDSDYDVSGSGQDSIADNTAVDDTTTPATPIAHGPVKVMVTRGSDTVLLGTAGGENVNLDGRSITTGDNGDVIVPNITREYGPILETAPDSGIFELDLDIRYTDGPASAACPTSRDAERNGDRFDPVGHIYTDDDNNIQIDTSRNHCILQGDILTVEYNDPTDASGDSNTITDSATFDLRNGVLQTDKPVYIIGSDMILTLIEPDFDLENDGAETYSLDLIEWDSDAATITMGNLGDMAGAFDPEPSALRETGDSTGIFQIVIEIPDNISGDSLERGEEIELEYTDWGPSGANYVGHEDEDVNVTVFTSNFGATIELDQNVYTWTDKVYITVVAPDHNFDGDLIDEIGESEADPLKVATRGSELDNYRLVETGTDTGIFTGEVILTGFEHDADGDSTTGENGNDVSPDRSSGTGPTNGFLPTSDDDGLTVSFEFSENETVVSSALIRWNIGEAQWLEASYPASGTGIVRVIDPDMNLNPEAVNNFDVDVFSDSDAGGISLTVTETNEATGIFEGTVSFTIVDESSGHRLRVAEGDTVTAEYEDNTLPEPYTTADELNVTATTLIGTVVPPLERLPITNLRIVDAFGNSIDAVSIDQQVQLQADLINGQDRDQPFAYLIQVQNSDGVTVKLDWIKGATQPGQSFSAAVSWTPATTGAYTATAFGWESIDNPTALSPPVSVTINVS